MPDLTVIVVTWNSASCIAACLESIAPAVDRCGYRVLIVDNASEDETVALIRRRFPWVRLVVNQDNRGFARANNQGFQLAETRYILLLNPDTVAEPGALDQLVACMDAHSEAWAAGPSILNADGTLQRTGVSFPSLWNLLVDALFLDRLAPRSRLLGRHRRLYDDPTRIRDVDYVQGSALMVRQDVLDRVGNLDDRFFMYFEETDWCFRMKRAGGRVLICPESRIVHVGGEELGRYDERRLYFYHQSLLAYYRKWHPSRLVPVRAILFGRSLTRLFLWMGLALARPEHRARALSCARGHLRCLGLALSPAARTS